MVIRYPSFLNKISLLRFINAFSECLLILYIISEGKPILWIKVERVYNGLRVAINIAVNKNKLRIQIWDEENL